ncbi:hypothetical protein DPMN_137214 [Dreissena polymorpha]|uniref:Uncharacterized protein n=1 Tax=Dreissena polymorpha TaxID=45954 RepID=A0A9D4G1E3_DREPO|nr:hypothetical protein DPMN_137214 [Dreissena polymorpha]
MWRIPVDVASEAPSVHCLVLALGTKKRSAFTRNMLLKHVLEQSAASVPFAAVPAEIQSAAVLRMSHSGNTERHIL